MPSPLGLYTLNNTISDVDFSGPDLVDVNLNFGVSSDFDYYNAAVGSELGNGFSLGYQFVLEGTIFGIFEIFSDGFVMGQHDGTNGVALKVENGVFVLYANSTTTVLPGQIGHSLRSISLSFKDRELVLVLDGVVSAVINETIILPASDFYLLGSVAGSDGVFARLNLLSYWNVYLGKRQPLNPKDISTFTLDRNYGNGDDDYPLVELLTSGDELRVDASINNYSFVDAGAVANASNLLFSNSTIDATAGGMYISSPNSTSVEWYSGDFTIEAWVYRTGTEAVGADGQPLMVGNINPLNTNSYWSFGISSTKLRFYYWNGAHNTIDSTNDVPLNAWSHVAVVFDFSANELTLYIDGEPEGTFSVVGTPQSNVSDTLSLGQFNNVALNGYFDQVRISDVARYKSVFVTREIPFFKTLSGLGQGQGQDYFNFNDSNLDNTGLKRSKVLAQNAGDTLNFTTGFNEAKKAYQLNVPGVDTDTYLKSTGDFDPNVDFFIALKAYVPSSSLPFTNTDVFFCCDFSGTTNRTIAVSPVANNDTVTPLLGFNTFESQAHTAGMASATACPLDTWFEIALQRSGDEVTLYLDGVLIQTESLTGITYTNTTSDFYIGSNLIGPTYTEFLLDEIRFFDSALIATPASGYLDYELYRTSGQVEADQFFDFNGTLTNTGQTADVALLSSGSISYTGSNLVYNGSSYVYNNTNIVDANSDFFMCCWATVTAVDNTSAIFSSSYVSNLLNAALTVPNSSTFQYAITDYQGGVWNTQAASTQPVLGQRHHYAFQRKGNEVSLFLDGALVATRDVTGHTAYPSNTWYLGYYPVLNAYIDASEIEEWLIYDYALIDTPSNGFDADLLSSNEIATEVVQVGQQTTVQIQISVQTKNTIPLTLEQDLQPEIGYSWIGDNTEAFRAPTSYDPFSLNATQNQSTTSPFQYKTPDPWNTKDHHIQGMLSYMDVTNGPYMYKGTSANLKEYYRFGKISGTVVDEFTNPVKRIVRLSDRQTGRVIKEQWSDINGNYLFRDLDTSALYTVTAFDYTDTYNAVVKDDVSPVADESP